MEIYLPKVFLWCHVRVRKLTEDVHVDAKEVYGIRLRSVVIGPWSGDPRVRVHLAPPSTRLRLSGQT